MPDPNNRTAGNQRVGGAWGAMWRVRKNEEKTASGPFLHHAPGFCFDADHAPGHGARAAPLV